jgi:uncharacterized membrane protein (UPF0136 family)
MLNHIIIIGFGLFLFSGAYFGLKAGSKISLIMGLVTGTLIILGDVLYRYNPRAALLYLMIVGGLLVVVFLQRLLQTPQNDACGNAFNGKCFVFRIHLVQIP